MRITYLHRKRLVATCGILLLCICPVLAQFGQSDLLSTGLKLLEITTINEEEPTCDFVFAPEGSMGIGTANATKVKGQLRLLQKKSTDHSATIAIDTLFDSGTYLKDSTGITLKIRGNTSAYSAQSSGHFPYKIKLEKKADLLVRGNQDYEDKEWALIATAHKFGNEVGRKLSQLMNFEYTPGFEYVNLFINGHYRGVYLLSEMVNRNKKCRIHVGKEGYIIEHDPYWWNEDLYFGNHYGTEYKYTFKYPDDKEVTAEKLQFIDEATREMESAILSGTYDEKIEVASFAKWLLAEDLLGSWDGGGVNLFLALADSINGTRFTLPCLWDYDSAFENGTQSWSALRGRFLFNQLLDSSNRSFAQTYCELWKAEGEIWCQNILSFIEQCSTDPEREPINRSFEIEKQWYEASGLNYHSCPFKEWIDIAKEWFIEHPIWMKEQIAKIPTHTLPIEPVQETKRRFDLYGRQVQNSAKGLVIEAGKKKILK